MQETLRDTGSIPGSGRSPGVGNGTPLQYSCLENHMDRGAWWTMSHRVAKSQRRLKQLSTARPEYLKVKVAQSCPTLMRAHGLYSPWNCQGQNTGVGNLSLLQRIFQIQGSNPGLPHCRQILYQLSYQGSPTEYLVESKSGNEMCF